MEGLAVSLKQIQQGGKREGPKEHQAGMRNDRLRILLGAFGVLLFSFISTVHAAESRAAVIVVIGAEGTKEYGEQFREWAARWVAAAKQASADFAAIGLDDAGSKADREALSERIAALAGPGSEPVWLVLIGHGTFDGKTARFGLRGPDFTPAELAAWLKPIERPLAIIDCTSASGPFLNELSAPNRVIVTAARSGFEYNYARFGDYISSAITDPKADLDKDDQTSLLEAFLKAASGVKEFYAGEGRLVTEHALIDDNGDKLGTPADWFSGLRATKTAKDGASLDGILAGQFVLVKSRGEQQLPAEIRARRNELERDLAAVRQRKAKLAEDEYLALIEPILVELAKLYQSAASTQQP
jgi:hypothetical protein